MSANQMIKAVAAATALVFVNLSGTGCDQWFEGSSWGDNPWGNSGGSCYSCRAEEDAGISRDLTTGIAQSEEQRLDERAHAYAKRFDLSVDQGMRIARTFNDFDKLNHRTERDVADFANRLYGINPNRIVVAAGKAQMGNSSELNGLITEAATRFETTPENMKDIVKTLHKGILEAQGISL